MIDPASEHSQDLLLGAPGETLRGRRRGNSPESTELFNVGRAPVTTPQMISERPPLIIGELALQILGDQLHELDTRHLLRHHDPSHLDTVRAGTRADRAIGSNTSQAQSATSVEGGARHAGHPTSGPRRSSEGVHRPSPSAASSTIAARTAIGELGAEAKRAFSENVDAAGKALSGEVNRLLGGEHPELLPGSRRSASGSGGSWRPGRPSRLAS
jgi:hypothetical protein